MVEEGIKTLFGGVPSSLSSDHNDFETPGPRCAAAASPNAGSREELSGLLFTMTQLLVCKDKPVGGFSSNFHRREK